MRGWFVCWFYFFGERQWRTDGWLSICGFVVITVSNWLKSTSCLQLLTWRIGDCSHAVQHQQQALHTKWCEILDYGSIFPTKNVTVLQPEANNWRKGYIFLTTEDDFHFDLRWIESSLCRRVQQLRKLANVLLGFRSFCRNVAWMKEKARYWTFLFSQYFAIRRLQIGKDGRTAG